MASPVKKRPPPPPPKSDDSVFDACFRLAEFGAGRLDARRNYEWKITFAVWTLLAAGTYRGFEKIPVLAGVVVGLGHASWLRSVWFRHASDTEFMWHFINEAQRIISEHGVRIIPPKKELRIGRGEPTDGRLFGFLANWSIIFQLGVTFALLLVLYLAGTEQVTWLFDIALKTTGTN